MASSKRLQAPEERRILKLTEGVIVSAKDEGLLDLADVLKRLGQEFREASTTDPPTIQWFSATVELESVVERTAEGGLKVYVVEGGGSYSNRKTIKITVNLAPFGGEPMVGGM